MSDQKAFVGNTFPDGYSLALHGGAGTLDSSALDEDTSDALHLALRKALRKGERVLAYDGAALDAVEAGVIALEDSPISMPVWEPVWLGTGRMNSMPRSSTALRNAVVP